MNYTQCKELLNDLKAYQIRIDAIKNRNGFAMGAFEMAKRGILNRTEITSYKTIGFDELVDINKEYDEVLCYLEEMVKGAFDQFANLEEDLNLVMGLISNIELMIGNELEEKDY